jgi:hypothetical protein
MAKHRSTVDHVVDAAREAAGWLDLLGGNCCAGRSYRRIDEAKASAACSEGEPGDVTEEGPVPAHRTRPV